jgi:hypothetical protein
MIFPKGIGNANAHYVDLVVRLLETQKKRQKLDQWLAGLPDGSTAIYVDPEEED